METLPFHCDNGHPDHPRKVGRAAVDDESVILTGLRRTGKGSLRARQSGSRLVEQGTPIQVSWHGMSAASFDADLEQQRLERHERVLKGTPPVGSYRCPEGHWVGTTDTDELLAWIHEALALGLRSLPLPPISARDVARLDEQTTMRSLARASFPLEGTPSISDTVPA